VSEAADDRDGWPHTGVILAGGASRRMGGKDKALLPLSGGRRMIDAVHDVLAGTCARVIVSGGADLLPDTTTVADARAGAGPLGGIEAVLASGLDEQYLFCPCDLPRLDAATVRRLTGPSACLATVLRVRGETAPRPLPARVAAAALPAVRTALDAGERAVRAAIARLGSDVIEIDTDAPLANVNTTAEYEALRRPRGGPSA
jgi:molybdopterin-guanine dinucleotide biosynthesis protein A